MAKGKDHCVVLLSIHPEYADAILDGSKRVEFRKPPFPRDVTHVVIYATSPVQKVVGWFQVDTTEETSPSELWKKYSSVGGIARSAFGAYYQGRSKAVAIHVSDTTKLHKPVALSRLGRRLAPPQNFRYLTSSALAALA